MKKWSLDKLYLSFEDEKYHQDYARLEKLTTEFIEASNNLSVEALAVTLKTATEYATLIRRIGAYISLRLSTNTTDEEAIKERVKLTTLSTSLTAPFTKLEKFIADVPNIQELIENNDFLKEHEFYLNEIISSNKYLLTEDVEEVISKLNINGSNSFSSLQQFLTSTLEVDFDGEIVTLPTIRNKAYSEDADERKRAYEAEIKSYDKIKDAVAFSINSIKGEVNTISELRGYKGPLDMTLKQSRMQEATLTAMLNSMKKYMPRFQAYLKRKGELLGHENGLPWYDMFAPMGQSSSNFTIESAGEYIFKNFASFGPDLEELARQAFREEWIDFTPRKGKVGGAFCANIPPIKESRILSNFTGTFSDVITLSHELGHAYHGSKIQNHSMLITRYTMPVAETASTFCETIVMNAALKESEGAEKLFLIESALQDATQIVCDIYSRFLFESSVFEGKKEAFIFSKDLEDLMIKAQIEAYGDGLDQDTLHQFMWINKGHYYSAGLSFYNFPYAFGLLFAKGLYAEYEKKGDEFLPEYSELLKNTTIMNVEEVALTAGIDVTKEEFWDSSLEIIVKMIEEFLEITA